MVKVILDPYDIYTTPLRELTSLEDVLEVGYDTKAQNQETVTLSIRERPFAMALAIDSIIHQGHSNYHSFVQRHAILYGISLVKNQVEAIAKQTREMETSGSIRDIQNRRLSKSGLPFDSTTENDVSLISMPAWCKEWVQSNCRYINMSGGRLAIYCALMGLSKATIENNEVNTIIQYEAEAFKKYLNINNVNDK